MTEDSEENLSSEMSAIDISNDSDMIIPNIVGNRPPKPSVLKTTCPLNNDKCAYCTTSKTENRTIKRDNYLKNKIDWPKEEEEDFKKPILDMFSKQSDPIYASARLWDDGIIDLKKTRDILGLSLSAALNAPIEETNFGIFRM